MYPNINVKCDAYEGLTLPQNVILLAPTFLSNEVRYYLLKFYFYINRQPLYQLLKINCIEMRYSM